MDAAQSLAAVAALRRVYEGQTRRSPAATGIQRQNKSNPSSRNSTAKAPFPPYGIGVANARNPNTFLFTGPRAWEMAKARRELCGDDSAMVLPEGHRADTYRWPVLACLLVNAVQLERSQAIQIGTEIARQGTALVVVACHRHELVFIRRDELKVAA